MTTGNAEFRNAAELRRQAEEQARNMEPASLSAQTPEEIRRLVHELRVHQIQLEMQNEELRAAEAKIKDGRDRYYDLYDLAPTGYCTLSEKGVILEANFTAATMLGTTRSALVEQPISRFIHNDDQDAYYLHHKKLVETHSRGSKGSPQAGSQSTSSVQTGQAGEPQECDLRIVKPDGTLIWTHWMATAAQAEDGTPVSRVALIDSTARKQAEKALRENEALLSQSQEIAHIGSWKLDWTTNRLTWTDEVYRMFGCKPQEFAATYEVFLDFVHPKDRATVDEEFSRSVREGNDGYDLQHRIVRRNSDEVRHIHARCVHERDESGAIIQSTGMVQDITEPKLAEAKLLELNMALEQSGDGIALFDMGGNICFVNKAWAKMHGYAAEELIEAHLSIFHTPEQLETEVIPFNERSIATGLNTGEMGHRRKNGSTFITHMTTSVVKNANGDPFRLVATAHDITERKQAETYREMGREILQILNEPGDLQESIQRILAALKKRTGVDAVGLRLQEGEDFPYFAQDGFSQDFLQTENTLVERGQDGGVCRDKDGNVCLECTCGLVISGKTNPCNPLFTQGGSSWTNDSFPSLDLPSDQDPRLHPRNNCIHQGYASVALIPVWASDRIVGLIQLNDKRKDRFTLETIEILEGIAAHIGSTLIRRLAKQKLQETNRQLEEAIARANILATEARAANQAKSRFLANMSHEIRTPMNAILGFAQILERDPALAPAQVQRVRSINRAGQHLLVLINDILDMAKIEAGMTVLKPDAFSLHDLLDNLLMMFRSRADAKGLHLLMERDPGVPFGVLGDEGKLRQVFFNLIGNAVKFTREGGVAVRVRAEPASPALAAPSDARPAADGEGAVRLVVEVKDSGPGIPASDLDGIFKTFEQSEAGVAAGGTGLGLAISRNLVEMMGGALTVQSEVGRGSCFRFDVLLEATEAFSAESEPEADRLVVGLAPGTGPWRILVVDDVQDNRDLLRDLLQSIGFEVREAINGEEALAAFAEWSPHAVLMDMRMPVMDGYEATRRIKAGEAGRDTPVIAVTASAFQESKEAIHQTGVSAYLRKPFQPKKLYEVLKKCLDLRYVYADEPAGATASPKPPALAPESVAALPAELRLAMREAVADGNMARLTELIRQVEPLDSAAATGLQALADRYDYEKLDNLLTNEGNDNG